MSAQAAPALVARGVRQDQTYQRLILADFPDPKLARTLSPNGRVHWATRKRAVDTVAAHVRATVSQQGLTPVQPRVWLTASYTFPDRRRRDQDNLTTCLKPVIDALVRCGVLPGGDHTEALKIVYVGVSVTPGTRSLEIVLDRPTATHERGKDADA